MTIADVKSEVERTVVDFEPSRLKGPSRAWGLPARALAQST
jgi:hypothetical protein